MRYSFTFDGIKYARATNAWSQHFFLWSPKVLSESSRLNAIKKLRDAHGGMTLRGTLFFSLFAAMQNDPSHSTLCGQVTGLRCIMKCERLIQKYRKKTPLPLQDSLFFIRSQTMLKSDRMGKLHIDDHSSQLQDGAKKQKKQAIFLLVLPLFASVTFIYFFYQCPMMLFNAKTLSSASNCTWS